MGLSIEERCATPSQERFKEVLLWLEGLQGSAFDEAYAQVEQALAAWKASDRALFSPWYDELLKGKPAPRALPLVRSLTLSLRKRSKEELAHLQSSGLFRTLERLSLTLTKEYDWSKSSVASDELFKSVLAFAANGTLAQLEIRNSLLGTEALSPLKDRSAWLHLRSVKFSANKFSDAMWKEIASYGAFENVEEFLVSDESCSVVGIQAWLDGGDRTRLRSLQLESVTLTPKDGVALHLSANHSNLERFLSWFITLNTEGCKVFLSSLSECSRLRALHLPLAGLREEDIAFLATLPSLSSLEVLGLSYSGMSDNAMRALVGSEYLWNLRELNVGESSLGDEGMQCLAASPKLEKLEQLSFAATRVGGAGIRALLTSPYAHNLKHIDFGRTRVGDEGVAALAAWPGLQRYKSISLGQTGVGPLGVRALAESPYTNECAELLLWGNPLGNEGAIALASTKHFHSLKQLLLQGSNIGDDGIVALASSRVLQGVKHLVLDNNPFAERGLEALMQSNNVSALERIALCGVAIERVEDALRRWAMERKIELVLPVENPYDT